MQILLLLSFLTLCFSEAELPFLTFSPGARAVSMGSAFVALADDATASYYNPAGLAFQKNTSIVSVNSVFLPGLPQVLYKKICNKDFPRGPSWQPGLYPGMRHFYLGATVSISEKESFGFGYTYLNRGKRTATDEYGNEIAEFEIYDYAAIISYGRNVYRGLGIGFSFKYIESFLCPEWVVKDVLGLAGGTATATAYDWGILYQFTDNGLSFGISCQNLGSEGVQYLSTATPAPIPALCRIGTCYNCVHFDKSLSSFGISSLMFTMDRINDLVGEVHDT